MFLSPCVTPGCNNPRLKDFQLDRLDRCFGLMPMLHPDVTVHHSFLRRPAAARLTPYTQRHLMRSRVWSARFPFNARGKIYCSERPPGGTFRSMIRPRGPRSNIMSKVKRLLQRQERRKRAIAIIAILAERYPRAFAVYEARRRPLKIGIYNDIEGFDGRDLELAMMIYTKSFGYLTQMRVGVDRIDLDGRRAGSVTEEDAADAQRLVNERLTGMRRGSKAAA
jgi:hypothetical protein